RAKDAVAVLEPLSKEADGNVPAKLRLAAIDFQEKRRQQAYQTVDEILKREPTSEPTLETKARFLLRDGRLAEAIKTADDVIKRNANALASLYIRGLAL